MCSESPGGGAPGGAVEEGPSHMLHTKHGIKNASAAPKTAEFHSRDEQSGGRGCMFTVGRVWRPSALVGGASNTPAAVAPSASCVCHTLSTPALRMKFPFLFHFSAKMGPLCWPRVLARLPARGRAVKTQNRRRIAPKTRSRYRLWSIFGRTRRTSLLLEVFLRSARQIWSL